MVSEEQERDAHEMDVIIRQLCGATGTKDAASLVTSGDFGITLTDMVNDSNTRSVCGVSSMKLLDIIAQILDEKLPCLAKDIMNWKTKTVMTMMAVKHTLTFDLLSNLLSCSAATCGCVIKSTISALASILQYAILWPCKEIFMPT